MKPRLHVIPQHQAERGPRGRVGERVRSRAAATLRAPVRALHLVPGELPATEPQPPQAAAAAAVASVAELADEAVARVREAGGPEDHATYSCSCGFVFDAPVSTTVACPHCGESQVW